MVYQKAARGGLQETVYINRASVYGRERRLAQEAVR